MAALTLAALTMAGTAAAQPRPAAPPAAGGRPAAGDKPAAGKTAKDDRNQPVTVDSDKMERFGKEGLVIFTGKVVSRYNNNVQYADRMEVYLDEKGDKILRTVSTGNVRLITSDCRTGTARRAEYYDLEQRIVLIGNARVWQEDNVVSGETITIYISQDRSVVEAGKQERVKSIFYQQATSPDGATAKKPAAPCAN